MRWWEGGSGEGLAAFAIVARAPEVGVVFDGFGEVGCCGVEAMVGVVGAAAALEVDVNGGGMEETRGAMRVDGVEM